MPADTPTDDVQQETDRALREAVISRLGVDANEQDDAMDDEIIDRRLKLVP